VCQKLKLKEVYTGAKTGNKYYPRYQFGHVLMIAYKRHKIQPVFRYSLLIPDGEIPDENGIKKYENYLFGVNFHVNSHTMLRTQFVKRIETGTSKSDMVLNDLVTMSVLARF